MRLGFASAGAFVLALLGAVPHPAAADEPALAPIAACAGKDLIGEAQRLDPAGYRAFVEKADAVPNIDGLLWKIEAPGAPQPSYLFGTIHATDDGAVALARSMAPYVRTTRTVATELGDALGPTMKAVMAVKIGLRLLANKADTAALIASPADAARIGDILAAMHMDPAAIHMPPWLLLTALAVPPCELERLRRDLPIVDQVVTDIGKATGARIVGLETIDEQIDALQSLDQKLAAHELVVLSRRKTLIEDTFATMLALYQRQRVGAILPATEVLIDRSSEDLEADRAFMAAIVDKRNVVMAARAKPLIEAGPVFIAVGALHLVGGDGLVALFRRAGYTVTRVP